jgi:Na+/glutamate symporter
LGGRLIVVVAVVVVMVMVVMVITSAIGEMWKSLDHSVMCTAGLGAGAKALLAASSRVRGCSRRLMW